MIIMAVMAPVLIMAVMAVGAVTIAVAVVSFAAVGGVVVGASERAYYAVARRRAARRREVPDNVVEWPWPTAQTESADRQASDEAVWSERWVPQAVERESVPSSSAACSEDHYEEAMGFESWEEVFPFEEPDFEQVVTYTLVAGSDF